MISAPFIYQIHADPYDFQRWTETKWKKELIVRNFEIEVFEIMGGYFTIICDMKKVFIKSLPFGIRHLCYLFYPLFDLITKLDNTKIIKNNNSLNKYHGGYFIVARRK